MKKALIAALLAGQLMAAAQPALAAELIETRAGEHSQAGAFAGLRLRLALDGRSAPRAGLAVAPAMHGRASDGAAQLAIGEGLELGIAGRAPLRLTLAGQDVRRLALQGDGDFPDWVLIGVGIAVVTAAGLLILIDSHNDSTS
ncbi:MAG: hypothetical protein ACT4OE_08995 [Sphingosinicella sp.]